jgi:hypothetical protein
MISFLLIAISAIVSDPRKAVLLNLKDVEILKKCLKLGREAAGNRTTPFRLHSRKKATMQFNMKKCLEVS